MRKKGENEGLAAKQAKERTRGKMLRRCQKVQKKKKKKRRRKWEQSKPGRTVKTEPVSGLPG